MKITLEITEIQVITGQGADKVSLITTLPEASHPCTDKLWLSFQTAKGQGAYYVRQIFQIEPKIVEV